MDKVTFKMWAEQSETRSRIMIKVGDDPPVEYLAWDRKSHHDHTGDLFPSEPEIVASADSSPSPPDPEWR